MVRETKREMLRTIEKFTLEDGTHDTAVPGLRLIRSSTLSDPVYLSDDKNIGRMRSAETAGFFIYQIKFLSFDDDKNLIRFPIGDKNIGRLSTSTTTAARGNFFKEGTLVKLSRSDKNIISLIAA
ncbi:MULTISPECIES: hypothetical protein [unclassified Paenibacillus]|uniref:hypothetical protein n=1 Tax=unclassified Paenibacillus TaxID=185978 RepID=UPI00362E2161